MGMKSRLRTASGVIGFRRREATEPEPSAMFGGVEWYIDSMERNIRWMGVGGGALAVVVAGLVTFVVIDARTRPPLDKVVAEIHYDEHGVPWAVTSSNRRLAPSDPAVDGTLKTVFKQVRRVGTDKLYNYQNYANLRWFMSERVRNQLIKYNEEHDFLLLMQEHITRTVPPDMIWVRQSPIASRTANVARTVVWREIEQDAEGRQVNDTPREVQADVEVSLGTCDGERQENNPLCIIIESLAWSLDKPKQ
jgi:type IV secretory pathway TrbF-like protein